MTCRSAFLLAAVLALAGANPTTAAAQLRPAPSDDILAATSTCRSAVATGTVDIARITSAGWTASTVRQPDGAAIESSPLIFGNGSNRAIILVFPGEGERLCTVMARLQRPRDYAEIVAAFRASVEGEQLVREAANEQMFLVGGMIMQWATTGSQNQPGVRVAIMKVDNNQ